MLTLFKGNCRMRHDVIRYQENTGVHCVVDMTIALEGQRDEAQMQANKGGDTCCGIKSMGTIESTIP